MRKYLTMTVALMAGLACAIAISACGGGGGDLSSANAQELLSILDRMQTEADAGNCSSVASSASDVANQIESRTNIDSDLKDGLVAGFQNLAKLAEEPGGCESTTTTTETTTTESTPTETTTTESTPTHTTTTQSTPTQTTPTQSTPSNPTGGTPGASGGISP